MLKKIGLFAIVLVALFVAAGVVMAAEEATKETSAVTVTTTTEVAAAVPAVTTPVIAGNKVCPVTGETIKELGKDTVEFEGKVYNLCCPDCKVKFLAEPTKYTAIVEKEMATATPEEAATSK